MQPPTASCPPGPSLPPVELRVDNDTMQILFLHSAATSSFRGRPASAGHVGRARGCQPPPPQRQPRAPARPGLPRLRRDTEVILVGGGGRRRCRRAPLHPRLQEPRLELTGLELALGPAPRRRLAPAYLARHSPRVPGRLCQTPLTSICLCPRLELVGLELAPGPAP
jgi:hypothetical protein